MTSPEPLLVLTTGGTIDKAYFDELSTYQVGETQVARLLELARVALPVTVRSLMRKDSLELDDADRAAIASAVRGAEERRIVITHGTDTMTHTAAALGDVGDKAVVLVGALAPARFAESDAPFNLGMAVATAQAAGPGVWITMNGTVFAADRVVKDRAQNRFVSREG
jgi:L-asparaginase